ncbi:hypothetical protein PR048_021126 [Dryococelus australis]|uniref:Uncharacterized protein n=1 Tax=Dryococelus australis TaxID=614101 RepID=A0ABQ9GXC8_9NEOP|nr:hypothetical protein PR048_021126 [Dryococelus australis]
MQEKGRTGVPRENLLARGKVPHVSRLQNFRVGAAGNEAGISLVGTCSPPTKANRAQYPARSLPDLYIWEPCWTIPLVGRFSRGSPVSPRPFIHWCSILTSIILTGCQDCILIISLQVRSRLLSPAAWARARPQGTHACELVAAVVRPIITPRAENWGRPHRNDSYLQKSGVIRLWIELGSPRWEASSLTARPTWPPSFPKGSLFVIVSSLSILCDSRVVYQSVASLLGEWSAESSAALNIEALRADEGEVRRVWSSAGAGYPREKTRRTAASSGTITARGNPGATLPGVEPGSPMWEARWLREWENIKFFSRCDNYSIDAAAKRNALDLPGAAIYRAERSEVRRQVDRLSSRHDRPSPGQPVSTSSAMLDVDDFDRRF